MQVILTLPRPSSYGVPPRELEFARRASSRAEFSVEWLASTWTDTSRTVAAECERLAGDAHNPDS